MQFNVLSRSNMLFPVIFVRVTFYFKTMMWINYSGDKKVTDPYNMSTMDMGSVREHKTYLKKAASLLRRNYVNNRMKIFPKR